MKILKIFAHFILLFIMPVSLVYSHSNLPCVTFQEMNYGYQHNTQEWIRPTTYDEIMQMLEDLELGELERKCSPIQIERVNEYLITLAKKGILPDEFEEEMDLEEDAYDLMYGEDSAFQLAHSLGMNNEYMIIPVVLNAYSDYDIVQCGKINKAWKNTKKFVKKHKKAIIIGSVVVVAATVVVVAVVAASSVTAATAATGVSGVAASGASSGSNSSNFNCSESGKSESKEESPSVSAIPKETSSPNANEMPIMKAAINEHRVFS